MTCIYEAYASRLGHRRIRLELEPVRQPELFCRYLSVETDEKKAFAVVRSIKEKISAKSLADRLSNRHVLAARPSGSDLPLSPSWFPSRSGRYRYDASMRQSPGFMMSAAAFTAKLTCSASLSVLPVLHKISWSAILRPKSNILSLTAPHFCGRMPSENWIILDDNRKLAAIHPADQDFYLTHVTDRELALLRQTEKADACSALWKEFFHSVSIQQRYNPRCQRSLMPLRYRHHMTEYLK